MYMIAKPIETQFTWKGRSLKIGETAVEYFCEMYFCKFSTRYYKGNEKVINLCRAWWTVLRKAPYPDF